MPVFSVTWNADEIETDSAREAAAYARNLIRHHSRVNSVFVVTDEEGNCEQIDLEDDEDSAPSSGSPKPHDYCSAQKVFTPPK